MIICNECNKNIIEMCKSTQWTKLYDFMEFLYLQQDISKETYDSMITSLLYFRDYALEEEKIEQAIDRWKNKIKKASKL